MMQVTAASFKRTGAATVSLYSDVESRRCSAANTSLVCVVCITHDCTVCFIVHLPIVLPKWQMYR